MNRKRNGTPLTETFCSCCGNIFTHKKRLEPRGKQRQLCDDCRIKKKKNSYYDAKKRALNGEDNYLSREYKIMARIPMNVFHKDNDAKRV